MTSDVMTVKEVAERLGIGINQGYQACERNVIPCVRFGRRWLIPVAAFENWLANCGSETNQGSQTQGHTEDILNSRQSLTREDIE